MRKWWSLARAAMTEGMRLFTYRAKDEKSKKVLPLALVGIAFLAIFSYAQTMMWSLKGENLQYTVLTMFIAFTAIMTLIEGVYKSSGLLFKCRDDDLLLALPLKKSEIVGLRIFKFYVFEVLYNALFISPAILAYMLNAAWGAGFIVAVAMMLLALPVIPVALSCVIGAATTIISTRFKKQDAMQTVLTLIFLTLIIVVSFKAGGFIEEFGKVAESLNAKIIELYYPARAIVNGTILRFNAKEVLKFIVVNMAVVAGLVFALGKFYFRIVSRANANETASTKKPLIFKHRSQVGAIVKKELNRYFNTPVLVSNTCMGLLLFLVAVVAIVIKSEKPIAMLMAEDFLTVEEIYAYMPTVNMALVLFAGLLTFISTTMFSLEGGAFNLLKTMPISGRKVIFAKVLSAMLIIVPFLLAGDLILMAKFKFGSIETIMILVATIIVPLATEMLGILIDLKYTRFDAESDAEVVKQSTGVLISSFVGLGMTVGTISITVVLVAIFGQIIGMMLTNGMFLLIVAGLWLRLWKTGESQYRKLSA